MTHEDQISRLSKGYAESPIGLVNVLSDEISGLVFVGKFVRANTLTPVPDDSPFDPWKPWKPAT